MSVCTYMHVDGHVWVVNAMLRVTPSAPFKSPAAHSI